LGSGVLNGADFGVGKPAWADGGKTGMITRRSLAAMSAKAGSVFMVYQGAASRRSRASSGWWPWRVYHTTVIE
jgi:hypothetical protein